MGGVRPYGRGSAWCAIADVSAAAAAPASPAALFEAHMQAELNGDLDATMATMVEDPHLINMASGTGGRALKGCVSSTPPS